MQDSPRKLLLTANKASCRTRRRDGTAYMLPLAHFTCTKRGCGYKRATNRKKKACRHAEPPQKNTREPAFAFCFDLNWGIVLLFLGKKNKTSLPFTRYTRAGSHVTLPPFCHSVLCCHQKASCRPSAQRPGEVLPLRCSSTHPVTRHSSWGDLSPLPREGPNTFSLAWWVSQGPGGCLRSGKGKSHTSVWRKQSRCAQWHHREFQLRVPKHYPTL